MYKILDYHIRIFDIKNIYFRSKNKNHIDLIDAEILDLTIRSTIVIKIS